MQKNFIDLRQTRKFLQSKIENLSIEQLNKIPKGFKNNIAWNFTHLVVTQQLLCYKLSNLDCLVSKEMIENFQKGSAPSYEVTTEEFEKIKALFMQLPIKLEEDYNAGVFKEYSTYPTSIGVTLNSVEDAISFNLYHEGIHLGIILQLLKFI
ncbi:DinB family protein [Lutibacter citreus]|uniref:DinB family protein n=1 Tax=Lutibacter citreus TaxID=2138210 RepID=UPI000DBE4906|nr:DinB family protein [Lutibacter citreus]